MHDQLSNIAQLIAGIAMVVAGIWCLCIKLPAERARQKLMVRATGVIHDGVDASTIFKKLSNLTRGAAVAAMPMVAFRTADGRDMLAHVEVRRSGRATQRSVFLIGQDVALRYDPVNPELVTLDGQPTQLRFIGTFCVFLLITGAMLAYVTARDLRLLG